MGVDKFIHPYGIGEEHGEVWDALVHAGRAT